MGVVTSQDSLNAAGAELRVAEQSDIGVARRLARSRASELGFPALQVSQVELVATEMATNLVKYATQGRLLVGVGRCGGTPCVELLSLDAGPGMSDPERHLVDGSSTGRSLGLGLGAIGRLSDVFGIYSEGPSGTAVMARVARPPGPGSDGSPVGAVSRPPLSETVCGDAWAVQEQDGRLMVMVADGLGHGAGAATASTLAVEVFRRQPHLPAEELVAAIHGELRATRGAAVSVVEVRPDNGVRFCGIGNVSGMLATATGRREMVTHHGTAGHHARAIRAFEYAWEPGALVILHSDGLSGRWDLADHPSLAARDPLLVAGVLYRHYGRARDDATVVVVAPGRGTP